jgi:hypothetical protein
MDDWMKYPLDYLREDQGKVRPAMRIIAALLLLLISVTASAQEVSPRKQALIDELHRVTQQEAAALEVVQTITPSFIAQMKRSFPTVPDETWKEAGELFVGDFRSELPLFAKAGSEFWARNFTESELEELITFYKTPTGQKLSQKRGELNMETRKAAQTWGGSVGRRAGEKVEQFIRSKGHQPRT